MTTFDNKKNNYLIEQIEECEKKMMSSEELDEKMINEFKKEMNQIFSK